METDRLVPLEEAQKGAVVRRFLVEEILPALGLREEEVLGVAYLPGPALGREVMERETTEVLQALRLLYPEGAYALALEASRLPFAPGVSARILVFPKAGGCRILDLSA